MPKRPTKTALLAEYSRLVLSDPSAAYQLGVQHNLRPKDMLAARDMAMIHQAREFHVVRYLGRDSREDRGVVRESLYEISEGINTLAEARAVAAAHPPDQYGRRAVIKAIVGDCPVGVIVPDNLDL